MADDDDDKNKGGTPSEEQVIKFIDKHPRPTDDEFHAWAEGNGFNKHKAEQVTYGILSNLINKGRSKGKAPAGIAPKDVKEGVKIEAEHTPNKLLQRKITDDHNTELKKYYDKKEGLPAMEKSLDKAGSAHPGRVINNADVGWSKKDNIWRSGNHLRGLMNRGFKRHEAEHLNEYLNPHQTADMYPHNTPIKKWLKESDEMDRADLRFSKKAAFMDGFLDELDKIAGPATLAKLRRAYPKGKMKPPPVANPTAPSVPGFPKAATLSGRAKYLVKRLASPIRRGVAQDKAAKAMDEGKTRKAMRYGSVSAGLGPSLGRKPKKAERLAKSLAAATA